MHVSNQIFLYARLVYKMSRKKFSSHKSHRISHSSKRKLSYNQKKFVTLNMEVPLAFMVKKNLLQRLHTIINRLSSQNALIILSLFLLVRGKDEVAGASRKSLRFSPATKQMPLRRVLDDDLQVNIRFLSCFDQSIIHSTALLFLRRYTSTGMIKKQWTRTLIIC